MLKFKYIFQLKYAVNRYYRKRSETVMVWNYQNADCSFKNFIVLFIIIFGTLSFPALCCRLLPVSVISRSSVETDGRIGLLLARGYLRLQEVESEVAHRAGPSAGWYLYCSRRGSAACIRASTLELLVPFSRIASPTSLRRECDEHSLERRHQHLSRLQPIIGAR